MSMLIGTTTFAKLCSVTQVYTSVHSGTSEFERTCSVARLSLNVHAQWHD